MVKPDSNAEERHQEALEGTGNEWALCTEVISDQPLPIICSLYSAIHKILFQAHDFKLI